MKELRRTQIPLEPTGSQDCVVDANGEKAASDTKIGLIEVQVMLSLETLVNLCMWL